LERYSRPDELIDFLSSVYGNRKFERLVEIEVKKKKYYCLLREDSRYIREDYLSSGEYFLINLYRTIRGAATLIVVDELDLSLDAAAQVHLLRHLRQFCDRYQCNVLCTTHSLAIMRMLEVSELLYMDDDDAGNITLESASYAYVKARLFGFTGWDRYILTEDKRLAGLIEAIIRKSCGPVFFKYKVIHLTRGGSQVVDLLVRNRAEGFLAADASVIAILDGDQRNEQYSREPGVYVVPVESVEKAIHSYYLEPDFPFRLADGKGFNGPKDLVHSLQRDAVMSIGQMYDYICNREHEGLAPIVERLEEFLSPNNN
jgi:energy-coupling factor transporter ATP-binding protein EcfA2